MPDARLSADSAMTAPRLSSDQHVALFLVLRQAMPHVVFQAIAQYYDSIAAVYEQRKQVEDAELARIARDGAEMVRTLLSETAAANDARTNELLAQLRASIDATRLRIPRALA